MSGQWMLGVLGVIFAGFVIVLVIQLINRDRRAIWPAIVVAVAVALILAIRAVIEIQAELKAWTER
jgi:hypothetical protein